MKQANSFSMIQGLAALVWIVSASGCNLLKSSDDTEAAKALQAAQALQSANAAAVGAAASAPTFVIEVPGANSAADSAREAPQRAAIAANAAHAAPQGSAVANNVPRAASSGNGVDRALVGRPAASGVAVAQNTRTTSATQSTTPAAVATTTPATAGLLAVGRRTAANSVSTATGAAAVATPPVATVTPPASTTPAAASTGSRRRPSVFSGGSLLGTGDAAGRSRGNRTVDAPTRQGAQ